MQKYSSEQKIVLPEHAISARFEGCYGSDSTDKDWDTTSEKASAENSRTELGLVPQLFLEEYWRKCAGKVSMKRLNAITKDSRNV